MLHEVDDLLDLYGVVGSGTSSTKSIIQPPPKTANSIYCGWCNTGASLKCLDCNEFMCSECLKNHRSSPFSVNHSVISARDSNPTSMSQDTFAMPTTLRKKCDLHDKVLQFVCEFCKKLICQCCTITEHENHNIIQLRAFAEKSHEKIGDALESISIGNKCIRRSIDKTLAYIRLLDRNSSDVSDNIRKTFRQLTLTLEDREKQLLDMVEKLKLRRLNILNDQMAGLKSALSGLAETADSLQRLSHEAGYMDSIDIVMKIINGERQLEQFASIYKDLQPKQESIVFNPPEFNLLSSMKVSGRVLLAGENTPSVSPYDPALTPGNLDLLLKRQLLTDPIVTPPLLAATASGGFDTSSDWHLHTSKLSQFGFTLSSTRITQCIPGALSPVHVRPFEGDLPSLSFGMEGHEDGHVSRPWGICVDKYGNIYISDRRNNRVQVFRPDGSLMFKFGRKGVGNGEFDLPAGICVDIDNRIIVVDKDNHRVQIFNSTGMFLLKFGSCGKEYGQFQYPWDVAVNSRRQIVVTDSRNHKIQQFDSEGRFIRQIVFENFKQNRGVVSPRGVCYTPHGNIIVSDFDNHCLYLIDPDINEILAVKGQEGNGHQEFNRPSGLCCDDSGNIIVADSKNQRIIVFNQNLEFMWDVEIRPSLNPRMPPTLDEKDRTCNVCLMPDGRIIYLVELSPDAKEGSNPQKRFIHAL